MISFRSTLAPLTPLVLLVAAGYESAFAAGNAPQPNVCTRGCWGARAASVQYGNQPTRAILHHTAGSGDFNTNGIEDSKANVRAIQNLHMNTNGWSDIGYHFLVDKHGNTFEGRAATMTNWVTGAHAYMANTRSVGFNFMGYFHSPYYHEAPAVMMNAVADVIAWYMPNGWDPHGNPGTTTGEFGTSPGSLCGHNEVSSTACPGENLVDRLGELRNMVQQRIAGVTTNNPSYYFDSGSQGWNIGGHNMSGPVHQNGGGWPGIVYGDQLGNDGFWWGPDTNYTGAGDPCVNVQVFPQSGSSANHDMQLFWRTSEENWFSGDKSSQLCSYVARDGWYSLNLSLNNPKYWGKNIKAWRLDFDNNNVGARFIVNHMLLQTTPRYFFGGSTDGWSSMWSLSPLVSHVDGYWGDIIYCDQTGNDAHLQSSRVPGDYMLGGANDYVVVRVYPQSGNSASHDMQVFWKTNTEDFYSAEKASAVVYYTAQENWTEVWLHCGANPRWAGNFISQIRLDLDNTNKGNRWIIDHIMVHHN